MILLAKGLQVHYLVKLDLRAPLGPCINDQLRNCLRNQLNRTMLVVNYVR